MANYSQPRDVTAALASSFSNREAMFVAAQGMKAETFPKMMCSSSSLMVDGTVYAVGIGLLAGEVISNVSVMIFTAGNTVTLSKVGLYDTLGNRLALSADQGTAWQSASLKTCAMIAPYTVPTSAMYYLASISKASVTLPTIARLGLTATAEPFAGFLPPIATMATQTDLPTSATFQVASGIPLAFWGAVS